MSNLYEFAVLGAPSDAQLNELQAIVEQSIDPFGLRLGHEVAWLVRPVNFNPDQLKASVAVFFGGADAPTANVKDLMHRAIPVIPVVSKLSMVQQEIPKVLRPLNCLDYSNGGAQRIATTLLECVGLLPRQRRIFLSYRRDEARQAALQLFEALSARLFDVFLDTHKIGVAEEFQAMLWHHLCDSDVLVMLDTPTYFDSRWTSAEFGRALAKGVSVLRIGWPDSKRSVRVNTANSIELSQKEIDANTGKLVDDVVASICLRLEAVRVESHAVRNVNLVSNLRNSIEKIQGRLIGVGTHQGVQIQLADGRDVVVYPTVGIPTSTTLHDASENSPNQSVAVIYDHIGIHHRWLAHLDWLGSHIRPVQCVKSSEAAWQFADWEDRS
ncbi:MAG: toll/interleukin-1 receptor domain-containing protein [Methylobacter sp.]